MEKYLCLCPFLCSSFFSLLPECLSIFIYIYVSVPFFVHLLTPSSSISLLIIDVLINYSIYPLSPGFSLLLFLLIILILLHINYSMRAAAANVGSATDASALLGVVTKGLQRLRAEVIL